MKDIKWDFQRNDIVVENGDLAVAETCSQQNAQILFIKSAANIFQPQYGSAAEERIYNMTAEQVQKIVDKAQSQIRDDGAVQVSINYRRDSGGLFEFEVGSKYRGE